MPDYSNDSSAMNRGNSNGHHDGSIPVDPVDLPLLLDAIRAVERHAGDGAAAIREMTGLGARPVRVADWDAALFPPP